jgi:hypothetical protein
MNINTSKKEIVAFLKYFYYVEGIAQSEGYNTEKYWVVPARGLHDKLMKARDLLGDVK